MTWIRVPAPDGQLCEACGTSTAEYWIPSQGGVPALCGACVNDLARGLGRIPQRAAAEWRAVLLRWMGSMPGAWVDTLAAKLAEEK